MYRSVRLASSLAAVLPDSHFEHPEIISLASPEFVYKLASVVIRHETISRYFAMVMLGTPARGISVTVI